MTMDTRFGIGGGLLSKVEVYKYLGLQIDSQLNFQSHMQNCIRNGNYKLTFFKKNNEICYIGCG